MDSTRGQYVKGKDVGNLYGFRTGRRKISDTEGDSRLVEFCKKGKHSRIENVF